MLNFLFYFIFYIFEAYKELQLLILHIQHNGTIVGRLSFMSFASCHFVFNHHGFFLNPCVKWLK